MPQLPTAISFALSALRPIMAAAGKDAEQCKAAGHMLSVFAEKLAELAEAAFEGEWPRLFSVACLFRIHSSRRLNRPPPHVFPWSGDVVVLMATVQTSEATASTPMR